MYYWNEDTAKLRAECIFLYVYSANFSLFIWQHYEGNFIESPISYILIFIFLYLNMLTYNLLLQNVFICGGNIKDAEIDKKQTKRTGQGHKEQHKQII